MRPALNTFLFVLMCSCAYEEKSESDYIIYSKILIKDFGTTGKLILELTTGNDRQEPNWHHLKTKLEGLTDDTLNDFIKKSKTPIVLERNFSKRLDVDFIEKEVLDSIFKNYEGWNLFYKTFGGTQGITTFSRIGYNKEKTQALIYIGTQQGWLNGAGYYILFKYKYGRWVESERIMVWIS